MGETMRATLPTGVTIAYEIRGSGPRLVWSHGLASCRAGDRDLIVELARRFTVLAYDARGHGESSPVRRAASFGYEALGADLEALLDHAGWQDAVVCAGASMGAGAGCRLAILRPSRVAALVMVRPASAGGPAPEWLRGLFQMGAEAIATGGIDAAIELLRTIPEVRAELERRPGRISMLRRDWERHDPESIAAALLGIPTSSPLDGGLDPSHIAAPTLVVPGDDPIHPTEAGLRCAELIPDAETAGPLSGLSRSEESRRLAELIADFCARRAFGAHGASSLRSSRTEV